MKIRSVTLTALVVLCTGCLPATKIYKNPGAGDHGIRYYRPKPYLFIEPFTSKKGELIDGYVKISTEMLPDFSEDYSIHIRSGLGTNATSVKLTDGWRLDSLNVDVHSELDKNFKAVTGLASAIAQLTSAGPDDPQALAVQATNVPLGYYEAVISTGREGKKRLDGFRYVGFMPYSPCPVESCGVDQQSCYDSQIYGLVFQGNAMVFCPLHEIAQQDSLRLTHAIR